MWCTRWYLPLVLLPLSTAPPYFLLLFLLSTTLHARPCFYCIVLVTSLFVTSCYWSPVPLDSSLAVPWSENVTTFSEALSSLMPNLPEEMKPAEIPLVDRCWCDISTGSFFEPYNTTQWEFSSVERLKAELEKQQREAEVRERPTVLRDEAKETEETTMPLEEQEQGSLITPPEEPKDPIHSPNSSINWTDIWHTVTLFFHTPNPQAPSGEGAPHAESTNSPAEENNSSTSSIASRDSLRIHEKLPLIRREYDLRPFGFAMVLDFGWAPSPSQRM